jgi:hypothetical protein
MVFVYFAIPQLVFFTSMVLKINDNSHTLTSILSMMPSLFMTFSLIMLPSHLRLVMSRSVAGHLVVGYLATSRLIVSHLVTNHLVAVLENY